MSDVLCQDRNYVCSEKDYSCPYTVARKTYRIAGATPLYSVIAEMPGQDSKHMCSDKNHACPYAVARETYRVAGATPLFHRVHPNPSTEVVHIRRTRRRNRQANEDDSEVAKTKSVEVMQLVQHEVPSPMRRSRTESSVTAGSSDYLLLDLASSTAVSSPRSVTSWQRSSIGTSSLFPGGFRKGCLRYPKSSAQEADIVAAADAVESGKASPYVPISPSRRLSCLSQRGRKRMVSVSYHNGNEDIGPATIEGLDGVRRPRLVVFQLGEGIDEVIPGMRFMLLAR